MTWLRDALATMPTGDLESRDAVRDRGVEILRPAGALRELDAVAAFMARWQETPHPHVGKPAGLIFAADHGVAAAGVSAYPIDVTAAMLAAYRAGKSTVSAFARVVGATVDAIDVGVGRPTGDIRVEAALSPERFEECVQAGRAAVEALDADLLVIGEMGIGNTTAAAAVAAAMLDPQQPVEFVGRGTGVDDEGMDRKREAVAAAVARVAHVHDPLEVLREVGGAELVAMAAAVLAARHRKLPVLLDGYVVTAAVLPLAVAQRGALDHCLVGHRSAEPGHSRVIEHLRKRPLLDLGMRLGEGSGAMAAVPLVAMACVGITDVPTFGEWFE
ncbi:MAG: nicotinate-nucleotide--dimethylbenzimidazole phosphoribosyltransferase [Actinobacteria bacterium]|nr:nicotinate-nucleotide--dimethylbenzimidazole phosphoribosyltransferase [Actinomycetota bacterium]